MLVRDEGRKHLKEKLVPSPLFHVQLVGLAGQVQGEDLGQKVVKLHQNPRHHLYGDGGAPHEENNDGRDDENKNEDGHSQPLLLVGRVQFIPHNLADSTLH